MDTVKNLCFTIFHLLWPPEKVCLFWQSTTNTLSGGTLFFYPFSKVLYLCNCKVNLFDRIKEKGIVRLSDEKKLFFDWLKMNAIWAKREMIEIVSPIYDDLRDVNKFVKSILKSRTYVRRNGETLYVSFPLQQSQKGTKALEKLCAAFNKKGNPNLGLSFKRMIFGVREKH